MSAVDQALPTTTLELRSTVADDATVTMSLHEAGVAPPDRHEVTVRIEAAPINPSDLDMTHSRIVVTMDGDLDDIAGIIYLRDLLLALAEDRTDLKVGDLKKPAHIVHESTPAHQLLHQFQLKRQHLFVVLDEYGGTSGVVSLEDVLEELVGEIIDETDPEEEESRKPQEGEGLPKNCPEDT